MHRIEQRRDNGRLRTRHRRSRQAMVRRRQVGHSCLRSRAYRCIIDQPANQLLKRVHIDTNLPLEDGKEIRQQLVDADGQRSRTRPTACRTVRTDQAGLRTDIPLEAERGPAMKRLM